jgi:SET family sugar efflux transporter-like MFS transporter
MARLRPVPASFVVSALLLLPVYGSMNSLLFANVRATPIHGRNDVRRRSIQACGQSRLPGCWCRASPWLWFCRARQHAAGLSASPASACVVNLGAGRLQVACREGAPPTRPPSPFLSCISWRSSLAKRLRPGDGDLADHLDPACQRGHPAADHYRCRGGTVADIGVVVGIVAFLEVVFIFVWARIQRVTAM